MAYTYYKHARVDRFQPRALGICDRCGMTYNRVFLRYQHEWRGAKIANSGFLVCESCEDKLQEQRRQIVLPANPIPIEQPRLESYDIEVNSFYLTNDEQALLTEAGIALLLEGQSTPMLDQPYYLGPTTNSSGLSGLTNPVPSDITSRQI